MLSNDETRLVIEVDHLRRFDPALTEAFLSNPYAYLPAFKTALGRYVENVKRGVDDDESGAAPVKQQATQQVKMNTEYALGFTGSLGNTQFQKRHVTPRFLNSSLLHHMISVEGIMTKCSVVRPKLVQSVHYSEKTGQTTKHTYYDEASASGVPSLTILPTKDAQGDPLTLEYGMSTFRDSQTAVIQEAPESAPAGQLPRSVNVLFEDDLVDRVKPGDRVQVFGVYRALYSAERKSFRTVLIANNIRYIAREDMILTVSDTDLRNIKKAAQLPDVFERLSASIAPSIYGLDHVKQAMLLLLMGGQEKITSEGMHLRGDIHMLLVGDPSTAKSQLLRLMLSSAPHAISTNGRGASGVGLTAAVLTDPETRERVLEAGAMVLADRGVVCVDEFDKMDINDRASMHEVMEQQTVTIQKAGVHTSLNARCSVLAAANPVYGTYNRERSVVDNVGFPDSLLSRFDLLFVVLDTLDPRQDRIIADHVLRMHMHVAHAEAAASAAAAGGEASAAASAAMAAASGTNMQRLEDIIEATQDNPDDADNDADNDAAAARGPGEDETPVYVQQGGSLYTPRGASSGQLFSRKFLRKYVLYAKHRVQPRLTEEARKVLIEAYGELRNSYGGGGGGGGGWQPGSEGHHGSYGTTLPITARTLDSMIRLSEAHARVRLSGKVEAQDSRCAIRLVRLSLFNDDTPSAADSAATDAATNTNDDVDPVAAPAGSSAAAAVVEEMIAAAESVPVHDIVRRMMGQRGLTEDEAGLEVQNALDRLEGEQRLSVADGVVYRLG
eukprot:TRINITY_DN132_c0_g1_i4.p1 TRINITY_DN132_c0_g1~~TRINITY_DN132_c0_g1_i4.p1  ORF type:complete len:834 (-),score=231.63 TRINITY_DN132_c0_g1_i4:1530-3875(-)